MRLLARFVQRAARAACGRRPVPTARLAKTRLCLEVLESRTMLDVSLSVGDNVLVRPKSGNQSETSIAINPTDPLNLFAVSNDPVSAPLFANYSLDGGASWNLSNVRGLPHSCCDAQTAWDSFGNLFVTYLNSSRTAIVTIMSSDGGQTFSVLNMTNGEIDQPSIAVGPSSFGDGTGSVWISYADFQHNSIAAKGAVVNGLGDVTSFIAAKFAPGSADGNFGNIAIGPNGQVIVTYESPSGNAGPAAVYVNLDAGGFGDAFGSRVLVTTTNVGGFAPITPQPIRSVDAEANLAYDRSGGPNNGRVYMVYVDRPSVNGPDRNDTDIYLRYSDDDGTTWSDPALVNDDGATGKAQFNPAIAVDESVGTATSGFLALTWYDCRNSPGNNSAQVWGSVSPDGGLTFLPNVQISTGLINAHASDPNFEFGDYDTMDFSNGCFYRSWTDNTLPGHNGLDLATAPVCVVTKDSPPGTLRPLTRATSASAVPPFAYGPKRAMAYSPRRQSGAQTDTSSAAALVNRSTDAAQPLVPTPAVASMTTEAAAVLPDLARAEDFFAIRPGEEGELPWSPLKHEACRALPEVWTKVPTLETSLADWSCPRRPANGLVQDRPV